ncbi:MAG: lamin tail domain-containing protein [Bacteroidetes bacterium]|nr:lamin tail domain-containing protein [Bacteroidota bacterium]
MLKRLIIPFILMPCLSFAQFTDDFEDADISNWTESTAGRWAASADSPLNGSYSLHHIFDNPDGDHDQVSVPFPSIELTAQSVTWRFKIRHKFDPSSANYWGVYLLSNVDANQMFPSGSVVDPAYGYIIGVNFTGTDDTLRLWKMELGSVVQLMSTTINWQNDITTSGIPAIEVIRKTDGTWIVNFDKDGDFNNLNNVGSINDLSYTNADYFGLYYEYTSSRDQAIWIDDIYIGPEIVDVIPPTIDSLYVLSSQKLKIEYSEIIDSSIAVTKSNYTLNGGIGNPDSIAVDVIHKNAELFFDQRFVDNQQYDITVQNIEDEEGNVIKDTTLNFTYEYIKPLGVEVISANELQVQFSRKVDTSSAKDESNYSLNNGIGNPSSAEIVVDDSTKVKLQFASNFINETYYDLTIQDLADQYLDSLQTEVMPFLYFVPEQYDVVINEIMADPSPSVNLPEYEYIEIKNTTQFDVDLTGWKLKIGDGIDDFPSYNLDSAGYVILCSAGDGTNFVDFGEVVEVDYSSITNSGTSIVIFDDQNNVIDSINFTTDWYQNSEKEDGGWSIEKIDPLNNCSGITNWKASEDTNGGTPGQENSVFASNIDNEAPQIIKVEILTENQLKITFDEPVTEESLLEKTNYQINRSVGNPFSVVASADLRIVDLHFLNSLPQETELILRVENLEDYCGNVNSLITYDFIYYVPQPYDVVINEIMANPDPPIALPEVEYIELFNTTEYDILLKDWALSVGTTQKYFQDDTIKSGEYLILCDDDLEDQLTNYGKTSVFSSLSLTDGGQTLVLRDKDERIISQVMYSEDWYQDDFKAEGGWSLEQIDPLNPCGEENNWIASESETGGTPGAQNSVMAENPDLDAPILLRITVVNDQTIKLFFNESIDSLSAMQTSIYSVDNGIGNPVTIRFDGVEYKSVILDFTNYFENNTIYNLLISGGLTDCAGNEIAGGSAAQFSIPQTPEENDIVINEILFNPLPDGVDFVEIYNRSNKTIDLADLLIASFDDEDLDFTSIERITEDGYLMFSGDYLVLTEDPEQTKQDYITENPDGFIKVDNLPGYNDDQGRVMVLDEQQNIIDNVGYNEDMQFALLATNEGVSLERINFSRPSDDKTNWHSASELVGFATPAYENSQFKETEEVAEEVKIDPEIFSPDNDGFEDFANLSFTFDEPGYVANIKIYDARGRLIRYLANNQLLGIEGTITWDGLDENNQKVPVGIYVVFIEIFDLEGNVKQYKKSVVVAARY